MANKTIQYNLLSLYCSDLAASGVSIPSGSVKQFNGVQSANLSLSYPATDIKALGVLNTNDSPNSSPVVNIEAEYLLGDGRNESLLGMVTDGNYGSFFPMHTGQKNFYMVVDEFAGIRGEMVAGIGNAAITNYGIRASLGDFVRVNFSAEGFNLNLQSGVSGNICPNVNNATGRELGGLYSLPDYTNGNILKSPGELPSKLFTLPREMELRIRSGHYFGLPDSLPISSFSLSVPLGRQPNARMGEKYPFTRPLDCPIEATLSINALITGLVTGKSLSFSNFEHHSFEIVARECCDYISKTWREECADVLNIRVNGAKLKGQSFGNNVESMSSIYAEFSILISNPLYFEKNILFSGSFGQLNNFLSDYTIQKSGITPSGSFQLLPAEPIFNQTGYFIESYRMSRESAIPNFSMDFSGNYYVRSGDVPPYFTGYLPAIQQKSGNLNSGLISRGVDYQRISTSLSNPALSKDRNLIESFSGFRAPATTGYFTTGTLPNLFPEEQAVTEFKFYSPVNYDFIVKSENQFSGYAGIKYYSDYPIALTFATGNFVTPARPFSINQLTAYFPYNNQADVGRNFDVYLILNSGDITKTYRTNWTVI